MIMSIKLYRPNNKWNIPIVATSVSESPYIFLLNNSEKNDGITYQFIYVCPVFLLCIKMI